MSKIKFYLLADSFFIFTATLFISFALIRYNGVNFAPSLLSSSMIGATISILYVSFSIVKKDGKANAIKRQKLYDAFAKHVAFMDNKDFLDLLTLYYKNLNVDAKIEKEHLVITSKKLCVFNMIFLEQVTTKDVINAYKQTKKNYSVKILYYKITGEALSLANGMSLRITLCNINSVYNAFEKFDLLPRLELTEEQTKIKIAPYLKGAFKKEKANKFLVIGVFLLFLSTITFFPIYYILLGCACIIISFALRFFKYTETKNNGDFLL